MGKQSLLSELALHGEKFKEGEYPNLGDYSFLNVVRSSQFYDLATGKPEKLHVSDAANLFWTHVDFAKIDASKSGRTVPDQICIHAVHSSGKNLFVFVLHV